MAKKRKMNRCQRYKKTRGGSNMQVIKTYVFSVYGKQFRFKIIKNRRNKKQKQISYTF